MSLACSGFKRQDYSLALGLFLISGWPTKLLFLKTDVYKTEAYLNKDVGNIKRDTFFFFEIHSCIFWQQTFLSLQLAAFPLQMGIRICALLGYFKMCCCFSIKKYLQIFNNTLSVYTTYLYVYLMCPWISHKALVQCLEAERTQPCFLFSVVAARLTTTAWLTRTTSLDSVRSWFLLDLLSSGILLSREPVIALKNMFLCPSKQRVGVILVPCSRFRNWNASCFWKCLISE